MNLRAYLSMIVLSTLCFYTQGQHIPKGTWQTVNMIGAYTDMKIEFKEKEVLVGEYTQTPDKEVMIQSDTIDGEITTTWMLPRKDTVEMQVMEILKVINKKKNKGIIYLKKTEDKKEKFKILVFNQIQEDLMIANPIREFESFEEMENIGSEMKSNPNTYDFDASMFIFRTTEKLKVIESLATVQLENKEAILKFLNTFEEKISQYDIPTNIEGDIHTFLMLESIFIEMTYNPYTSLKVLDQTIQTYRDDEDIQKINHKIEESFKEKLGK